MQLDCMWYQFLVHAMSEGWQLNKSLELGAAGSMK